jgi:rSAM/selenodomain-associated transferase 2
MTPTVAVIVPVRNEVAALPAQLRALADQGGWDELIVCDGGSSDGSADFVRGFAQTVAPRGATVRLVTAVPGRARQMNAAAGAARAQVLLFLHADTQLPRDAFARVREAVGAGRMWGHFDVRLSGRHLLFRVIERLMSWRSRISAIATGDQAMFVRADVFRLVGGFPDQPLMEDVELSRRLKWIGPPARLHPPVTTSSRRWERHGILCTVLLMWALRFLYWCGVSPVRLARWYKYGD